MLNCERDDEEWLSQYLPLENIVANYSAIATTADSSNADGKQKIKATKKPSYFQKTAK